jgi:glutathione S-transferase
MVLRVAGALASRRRLDDFLNILDGHLQSRAFVIGDRATITDIS